MSLPMSQYTSSTILLISSALLLLLLQLGAFSAEASFITISPHHSHPLIPAPNSNVPSKHKQHHQLTTPHVKAPAPAPIIAFSPHNSHPLIPAPDFGVAPGPQSTPHAKAPAAPLNAFSPHNSHPLIPAPDFGVAPGPQSTPHAKAPAAPLNAFSPHNSHPLIPAPESFVPSVAPANSPHTHNQPSHHHHHNHNHLPPKNVVANSPSPKPSLHFNKGPVAPPITFSPHNSHPLIQAPESIVPSEAPAHPLHAHNTHSHHHLHHNSHPLIPAPISIVPSVAPANSPHAHNQPLHHHHHHHHHLHHHHHHLPPKNVVANSPSPKPSLHFNNGPSAPPIAFSPHNSQPLIQAPESIVPSEAPAHPLHAHNTHSHHHHLPPKNVVEIPPSPTPSLQFSRPNLPPFKP